MNLYYLYGSKYLKKTNCLNLAPIEAVSSQRSEEIKPKAGKDVRKNANCLASKIKKT